MTSSLLQQVSVSQRPVQRGHQQRGGVVPGGGRHAGEAEAEGRYDGAQHHAPGLQLSLLQLPGADCRAELLEAAPSPPSPD